MRKDKRFQFQIIFFFFIVAGTYFYINNTSSNSISTSKTDFLICMFLTAGLNKEAENSIASLSNQKLHDKLVVSALDNEAFDHINGLGIRVVKRDTNLKKIADFRTKEYNDILLNKLDIILEHLKIDRKIVVYSDTDVVFLDDLFDDIERFKNSDYDMMIQNDVPSFDEFDKSNLCAGFMFLKPNKKVIEIIKKSQKKALERYMNDQQCLNEVLKNDDSIKYDVLDLRDFPNGKRYFDHVNSVFKEYTPKIVHNNWLFKTADKVVRFKKHNLWFIQ